MCSIGFKVGSKLGMGIDCALSLSGSSWKAREEFGVLVRNCSVACCMGSGVVMLKDSAWGSQEWDGVCLCSYSLRASGTFSERFHYTPTTMWRCLLQIALGAASWCCSRPSTW